MSATMSDAAAANPGMSGAYLVRSMRLLIIEDDRDAADYLVKAFREVGHVADHAADGEDGLRLRLTAATTSSSSIACCLGWTASR